jgi:hypothetical protein
MIKSRDELLMEMAKEYRLNRMGDNDDDVDEHDDDEGNTTAPPAPAPPAVVPEEIVKEEAPVVHEVILADAELELPRQRLFNMIMRDYEERRWRMVRMS